MKTLHSNRALVSVLAAAMLSLSACGGGGGGSGGGDSVVADKCAAVAGAGDPVQAALVQLSASLTAVPGAGASAASLVDALSRMVDAVDALANVLQAAGVSQDPAQIADAGNSVGDAASCGLDEATIALEALSAQVGAGSPSGLEIDQIEATIADLQAFLATDPFAGGTTPPSLSDVAAEFGTLSDQLDTLASLLPVELSGRPEARLALAALADGIDRFGVLLVNVGNMDANGTAGSLTGYYGAVAADFAVLTGLLPAGVTNDQVEAGAAQVRAAALTVVVTLNEGLVTLLTPIFAALQTVLGGGDVGIDSFQVILEGLMADTPVSGEFAALIASLAGGGSTPSLDTLMAGITDLAALVQAELDAQNLVPPTADPLATLTGVLNGAGGLPSLTDTLADLPGMPDLSLSQLQNLVMELVDSSGGTPQISTILAAVGGNFTTLNLDDVVDQIGLMGIFGTL